MSVLPPLRYVDVAPIEHDGHPMLCLSDPAGYVDGQILLSPQAFFIAVQLDGQQDIAAVQAAFAEQFGGQQPSEENIVQVVQALDEHGFLDTPRFAEQQRAIARAFAESPTRPAYFAGRSYPDCPQDLRLFLDECFTREGGPGARPAPGPAEAPVVPGIVAPHIDFQRGGHGYAHAYASLLQGGQPDVVFVFGVAHLVPPVPFVLSRKDFETPFGTLATDQAIVDSLAAACTWDPFERELLHRTEHSVEFQTTMLAHLYGTAPRIVPVLCAPLGEEGTVDPAQLSGVQAFLGACRQAASAHRSTAIASADLAHVGRAFGDEFEVDEAVTADIRTRDHTDLEAVQRVAGDAWYAAVMQDANARKVCGVNCIYATLKTLEGTATRGELLHYDCAPDPSGGIVSFASVALA